MAHWNFEHTTVESDYRVSIGGLIRGVHKQGKRPISITLYPDDLLYLRKKMHGTGKDILDLVIWLQDVQIAFAKNDLSKV